MIEFISALTDPDNEFLRLALYVALLSSIPFGIIGTYVVTRRISYLAGAISHCVFGGIGAGLYLQKKVGIAWFDPMYGAVISALLAAVIIGLISLYGKQREDTVIGALWAVGMAAGLLFIDNTPGYFEITSYLFGDILLITPDDVRLVGALCVITAGISLIFYNKFLAFCFDEEFARLRGINTGAVYILLLCITALTVVLLVRIVGIVLVIALLTIPPAAAGLFTRKFSRMIGLAIVFSLFFNWTGLALSFKFNVSSGPTIIVFAGFCYLTALLYVYLRKRGKHHAVSKVVDSNQKQ